MLGGPAGRPGPAAGALANDGLGLAGDSEHPSLVAPPATKKLHGPLAAGARATQPEWQPPRRSVAQGPGLVGRRKRVAASRPGARTGHAH